MSAFFTANWYRVAGLRPRLLADVRAERQRYGRQAWYAVHDRLSGRVHRLTTAAFLFAVRMDGRRTVDEIWQELVAEMDADAPGQEAVMQLLMQLHGADLLAGDIPPDAAELLSRRDRLSRAVLTRNVRSPLSIQLPLFDPDRMLSALLPLVRPLLGPVGLLAWLVLVAAGGRHGGAALGRADAERGGPRAGRAGPAGAGAVLPRHQDPARAGARALAKHFGCEVREVGVMLLIFFPVPYVDVSNTSALPSRWQRAAVAAAGIAVEVGLAAAAALVWAAAEPGLLRAVAFNVMVIGGVSTVLVNGNPLLRFDGYYVLSDVLGVPNLAPRAARAMGHLANRYLLGVRGLRDLPATAYERAVLLTYAPLSWCYRIGMMVSVSLFVATQLLRRRRGDGRADGDGRAGLAAAAGVGPRGLQPGIRGPAAARGGAHLRRRWQRARRRCCWCRCRCTATRRAWSGWTRTRWCAPARTASSNGWKSPPGTAVTPGTPLFTLRHALADARMRVTAARVDELRAKLNAEWVTDRLAAGVTGFELRQQQAALAREQTGSAARRWWPARPACSPRRAPGTRPGATSRRAR